MQNSLPEMFHEHIGICIDKNGIYPHIMIIHDHNDKYHYCALDLKPLEVTQMVLQELQKNPKQLIFGLDRYCKEGQGTDLQDCVGGFFWNGEVLRPYIIEYQNEPRIIKPLNWDNKFWNAALKQEWKYFLKQIIFKG